MAPGCPSKPLIHPDFHVAFTREACFSMAAPDAHSQEQARRASPREAGHHSQWKEQHSIITERFVKLEDLDTLGKRILQLAHSQLGQWYGGVGSEWATVKPQGPVLGFCGSHRTPAKGTALVSVRHVTEGSGKMSTLLSEKAKVLSPSEGGADMKGAGRPGHIWRWLVMWMKESLGQETNPSGRGHKWFLCCSFPFQYPSFVCNTLSY